MKTTFITRKIDFKKVVLGALAASFVLAPLAAQAAPPDYAPAYGYRNKAEKKADKKNKNGIRDRDRDGYDDRDIDRDGDIDEEDGYDYRNTPGYQNQYGNNPQGNSNHNNGDYNNGSYNNGSYNNGYGDNYYYGNNHSSHDFRDTNRNGIDDRYESGNNRGGVATSLSGVVTRDLRGRRFEIRANNRTYVVVSRGSEPLRLTKGDTVLVMGRLFRNMRTSRNTNNINNAFILADRVRITRNDDQNQNGSLVNFTARVLDVRNDRELRVRTDNGRTYTVRSNNRLSSNINDGNTVYITGRLQNNVVEANRVELRDSNNQNDGRVDFKGRVESLTNVLGIRIITVRGDNGATYRVRFSENTNFRNGDRVRVRGDARSGIVFATNIDRI